jgi:cell division topological specificity factor
MAFSFFDYFKRSQKSASLAKDRLSIIVARERATTRGASDYLPQLQQELLAVIARYEKIDLQHVSVRLDSSGGCEVLELNIVMPEDAAPAKGLGGGAGSRPAAAVSSHV